MEVPREMKSEIIAMYLLGPDGNWTRFPGDTLPLARTGLPPTKPGRKKSTYKKTGGKPGRTSGWHPDRKVKMKEIKEKYFVPGDKEGNKRRITEWSIIRTREKNRYLRKLKALAEVDVDASRRAPSFSQVWDDIRDQFVDEVELRLRIPKEAEIAATRDGVAAMKLQLLRNEMLDQIQELHAKYE